MVPLSEINEARRTAAQRLETARLQAFAAKSKKNSATPITIAAETQPTKKTAKSMLQVQVDTAEKAEIACQHGADSLLFGGDHYSRQAVNEESLAAVAAIARRWQIPVQLATPRMITQTMEKTVAREMQAAEQAGFSGICLSGMTALALAKENTALPRSADWTFNVFNSQAVTFLAEAGVERVCLSPELTLEQIGRIAKHAALPVECLIHGKMPLMISAYCVAGSFIGDLHKGNCQQACGTTMFLQDRKDECFQLVTDQYCRMHVLNGKMLSLSGNIARIVEAGVSTVRIDGRAMLTAELAASVTAYHQELMGGTAELERFGSTRGHFFRGVLTQPE